VAWARAELGSEILIAWLMQPFKCSRRRVQSAFANGAKAPKSGGWQLGVEPESEANISAWIKRNAEKNAAVTRTDIRNYCCEVCKYQVSRGWFDSFISRHTDEPTETKSSTQEEPRLQVLRTFLEETRRSMHEAVQGCPAELVFNLDEAGISDWEN
jgi:hypothetical protein